MNTLVIQHFRHLRLFRIRLNVFKRVRILDFMNISELFDTEEGTLGISRSVLDLYISGGRKRGMLSSIVVAGKEYELDISSKSRLEAACQVSYLGILMKNAHTDQLGLERIMEIFQNAIKQDMPTSVRQEIDNLYSKSKERILLTTPDVSDETKALYASFGDDAQKMWLGDVFRERGMKKDCIDRIQRRYNSGTVNSWTVVQDIARKYLQEANKSFFPEGLKK